MLLDERVLDVRVKDEAEELAALGAANAARAGPREPLSALAATAATAAGASGSPREFAQLSFEPRSHSGPAPRELAQLSSELRSRAVYDDLMGEQLPAEPVQAVRADNIALMQGWGVWEEVAVDECRRATGRRPLGGRWVDVDKGDRSKPDIRSRYVAQEVAVYRDDDYFAATPLWRPSDSSSATRPRAVSTGEEAGSCWCWMPARRTSMHRQNASSTWNSRRRSGGRECAGDVAAACTARAMPRPSGTSLAVKA